MAAPGTQHLLGRPQRIAPLRGAHQGEMGEVDAGRRQGRRVRQMRRREQHHPLARPREGGKRRQHELQLAEAFAPREDLGERACRPAAAGQLAVELGEARRHRRHGACKRSSAPHRMPLQDLLERRRHILYLYTVKAQLTSLQLLQRLLLALFVLSVQSASAGEYPRVWLNPGFFTHHFKSGDYREDNYGPGVEVAFSQIPHAARRKLHQQQQRA